jgi:hypothetical protein
MQYAVLMYDDERQWVDMTPEAGEQLMDQHMRFQAHVYEVGGQILDGHELAPTASATSLRWSGDDVTVSEGPYAETTEQFGGVYVLDLPDLDAAIAAVKILPHHAEIRPVVVPEGAATADAPAADPVGDTFLVLLYGDEEPWLRATPEERDAMYAQHGKFAAGVFERGAAVAGGSELAHSSTATTVRRVGGDVVVTDGPFAETAEQLTGYYAIQAASASAVAELLDRLPGEVTEIRPTISRPQDG